ncbi:unnamed protein product [Adineta ricciae]|uniref:F-box domain-containing protein n=1 Tax=Adineta ricciae TaxID=249248 RepID=A0A815I5M6_ADIRI|nr:unnamed protein product [Adineta ricciae]CAF1472103.1 unnamed protein product [Adineta ricciae]
MSNTNKSYLDTLPTEILYRICDGLDSETILFSFRRVCKRFHTISKIYDRYRLDLCYFSMSDLRRMEYLIDPKNVTSLTLANEDKSSGLMEYFLDHFSLRTFSRLDSMTFALHHKIDFDRFAKFIEQSSLTTLSIWLCNYSLTSFQNLIEALKSCRLKNLIILDRVDWTSLMFIVNTLTDLQKLVLKSFHKQPYDNLAESQVNSEEVSKLTSLSLNMKAEVEIQYIESILMRCPHLQCFQLDSSGNKADKSLFDGHKWENLIETRLLLLKQFEFHFSYHPPRFGNIFDVDASFESFQTPFWRDRKQWFVRCDYVASEDKKWYDVYTVPMNIREEFDLSCHRMTILDSMLPTMDESKANVVHVHRLTLNLNQLMIENTQTRTNLLAKYQFRNVKELVLIIDQEWSNDAIECLSTMIVLSNLEKIHLKIEDKCKFVRDLYTKLKGLLKQAWDLRSLKITSTNPRTRKQIIRDKIALKLSRYTDELDIEVQDLDDAKAILQNEKYLSHLTFRPILNDNVNLVHEIEDWLPHTKRHYTVESAVNWLCDGGCCTSSKGVYIWLD